LKSCSLFNMLSFGRTAYNSMHLFFGSALVEQAALIALLALSSKLEASLSHFTSDVQITPVAQDRSQR